MIKLQNPENYIRNYLKKVSRFSFDDLALMVFRYQYEYNELYRKYCDLLKRTPVTVQTLAEIPFLPISFYKMHKVQTGNWNEEKIFRSSGTTETNISQHFVQSLDWYDQVSLAGILDMGIDPESTVILALLPGYMDRQDSSLIHMVNYFIQHNQAELGGFYRDDFELLQKDLECYTDLGHPCMIWGVSFALLDWSEEGPVGKNLSEVKILETGGMKGRREEVTRSELHRKLCEAFGSKDILSEYGMTELLSQAYSLGGGLFTPSSLMRVLPRSITDPLSLTTFNTHAALNVIDLANWSTCSFIATDDLGIVHEDGCFEVLGRLDNSDVRGCNLMYSI